jgi:autotransporter translocation and assembly factor TamB
MVWLGFSAGLPFLLVDATLSGWLRDVGIERSVIGFFSWVGIIYSIKVVWAPVVDRVPVPFLAARLGRSRSWMLLSQQCIAAGLAGMALVDTREHLEWIALLSLLAAAGTLLLAATLSGLALLRSEAVLRWGIDQATPHLPCQLRVGGVSGPLAGPIRIGHLECGNADFQVIAEGVELVWSPLDLVRRHLHVERLRAASLSISVLKPSERPPALPASLVLPITAEVTRLELDRVRWTTGGRAVELTSVIAALQADGEKHRIALRRLASPWGELTGSAELGTRAPFGLRADAHAKSTALPGWPAEAEATVTGRLEDLQVAVSGSVGPVALSGSCSAAPTITRKSAAMAPPSMSAAVASR